MKRLILIVCLLSLACGAKPVTGPSPIVTVTRIIALGGNLDFGNIQVGQSFSATLEIKNTGTAALTITGMTVPTGGVYASSFTSGTIQPGATQSVTIRFTPAEPKSYNGTLTVQADQTSGTNTIAIAGTGSLQGLPVFSKVGSGDTVFNMPTYVARIKVVGTYPQNSSNFVVRVDGRLLVNELLGTGWNQTRYEGTLLTGLTLGAGGVIAITNSSGVAWSFEEVR